MEKYIKKISGILIILAIVLSLAACSKNDVTIQNNSGSEMSKNVIYDNEGVKAEITGFSYDGQRVWSVGVKLTNNTNQKIGFNADGVTVNTFLCGDAGVYIECESGTYIEGDITFDNFDLAYNIVCGGLSEISSIGIQPVIAIYKDDSTKEYKYGDFKVIDVEKIDIPIANEANKQYSFMKKSNDVVFENESYKVTCLGIADDFKGIYDDYPHIYFKVENKTDSYVKISLCEEYESYAEILSSFNADKKAVINGKACTIKNFVSTPICPNSVSIFSQLINIEDLGITTDKISSYANEFEIDEYYLYNSGFEDTEECNFSVEIEF